MNIKNITLAITFAATVASPMVMAAGNQANRSFTADVTRSNSAGRTMSRHTEQVANQHRIQRQSTWTNGYGKTATRSMQGSYNPDNKTYTRSVEGTRFNGETHSATVVKTYGTPDATESAE